MTIDETHFYKAKPASLHNIAFDSGRLYERTLNSNRLSYEEGVKDGTQEAINILRQHVNELMAVNQWAKANHYLKAIELIRQGTK